MLKKLHPIITLLAIALMVVMPNFAQDAEETPNPQQQLVFDRVDQAMEHLNSYVTPTPERAISRQFNYWSWSEQVWNDTSLGCPLPDQEYEITTVRGPQIVLTFNNIDYNYRMNWDGSLVVLCSADNAPLYRSDAPDAGATPSAPIPVQTGFYFWAYDAVNQNLYLVNSVNGQIATTPRPRVANEAPDGLRALAFSPDGLNLFQVVMLNDGNQALNVFNTTNGATTTINADAGHAIWLGFGDHVGSLEVIGRIPASADGRYIPIGFSNESDPSVNSWKVSVYDLETQAFVSELTSSQFNSSVTGSTEFIEYTTNGAKRPVVQFVDNGGNIHFSLVLLFAGGSVTYPTASWNPATNAIIESPYMYTASDVLPSGVAVYSTYDESYPNAGGESFFDENNVIFSSNLSNTAATPQLLVQEPERGIYNVFWSNNGNQIIYTTQIGDDLVYKVYDPATGLEYTQYGQTIGTNNGVLTAFYDMLTNSAKVTHYTSQTAHNDLWSNTALTTPPVLVWAEMGAQRFGIATATPPASATETTTTTATVTPAPDACGELPSRVTVGVTAQTTEIEGVANFNLRETARLTAAVLRILPSNTQFTVTGGPTCSSGFTWWNVTLADGLSGWLAEGFEEDYYIAPASAG